MLRHPIASSTCSMKAAVNFPVVSQHFLLSAKARTLSLSAVLRMTDQEAEAAFIRIGWGRDRRQAGLPALRMRDRL